MDFSCASERCDDSTPAEVWAEYEAQKRALDARLDRYHQALYRLRQKQLERITDALGCGLSEGELSDAQRAAQAAAVQKHLGSRGCAR
jgi:hypothetical protein